MSSHPYLTVPPAYSKSTLASLTAQRINALAVQQQPDGVSTIAVQLPMDGFHLYKRQLDEMADPVAAHARRGAHWTFNAEAFVGAVKQVGGRK